MKLSPKRRILWLRILLYLLVGHVCVSVVWMAALKTGTLGQYAFLIALGLYAEVELLNLNREEGLFRALLRKLEGRDDRG